MKDLIGSDIMVPFTAGEFVTIIEPCDDMESYVGIEGEETGAVSAGFGIFGGDWFHVWCGHVGTCWRWV